MKVISEFLEDALPKLKSGSSAIESRHIDDLSAEVPETVSEQLSLAFELYNDLIERYKEDAGSIKAMLVFSVGDSEELEQCILKDLLEGKLELSAPPELYLIKRTKDDEPYVVEEYKRPVLQNRVQPSYGCIYAYYRAHKNEQRETFAKGFYFEHYLAGDVEHNWV